jgi:DNA-binding CsgD family transcriptional regulator
MASIERSNTSTDASKQVRGPERAGEWPQSRQTDAIVDLGIIWQDNRAANPKLLKGVLMRLSHSDMDRILRILPELYAYSPPLRFFETSVRLLHELIGCDYSGLFQYEYRPRVRLATCVESDQRLTPHLVALLEEAVPLHPYIRHYATSRETTAVMSTEMPARALAEHKWKYQEIYRVFEQNYGLMVPIVLDQLGAVGISFHRDSRRFAERQRSLLNALQPHLQRAYANAQLVARNGDQNSEKALCDGGLPLTEREAQIALWLAEGKTNGEIGLILGMATRTVEKHVEHILAKLCVENRTTAALEIRCRLTPPPSRERSSLSVSAESAASVRRPSMI